MEGRYIWIWELNRCENGDVDTLIYKAKSAGIDGYIIKSHDGSSFWYQSYAITEIKNAGLKCGAWGYCYGKNIAGEISAIKKTASLNPDFYVLDAEAEFEDESMRSAAEQLLEGIKDVGILVGYTSFAIPSYHTVPFDIFSNYCSFAMPQIYWADMKWQVKTAFYKSIEEYRQYNLPVYPIGQITSEVPAKDILDFNSFCSAEGITSSSYWSYQDAGQEQFDALKESGNVEFSTAVTALKDNGIINSPEYWLENAVSGMTVNGDYARQLILRMAKKLGGQ